jgi:4-amino-4-deoxy-L-arabinose transferase-like glycosyltransferase
MSKKTLLLFAVIFIVAGFLRLYHLKSLPPGLYPDEAMNGNNTLEALATGDFKVFYPENNGREGLFINIQGFFLKAFGANEPWVLRLPSALFGTLTVAGLYFLARELFSRRVALLAAFLLATSFWHLMFSRIGFRAITAPFWLTWGLFFLLLGFRKLRESKPFLLSTFYFLLSGALYGLGFHSYIAYRATPPLVLLIFLVWYVQEETWAVRKKILLSFVCFVIAAAVATAPLFLYFAQNPGTFFGRTSQVSVFASASPAKDLALNVGKTALMFFWSGDHNWRHNFAGRAQLFWPVALFLLAGLATACRAIARNITRMPSPDGGTPLLRFWILFAWIALAAGPVVISNEGIPHALRAILMIPPVIILAALGGVKIYDALRARIQARWFPAAVFIFLSLLFFESYHTYFVAWAKNPNIQGAFAANYVDIGRELNKLPNEFPKYIIVKAGGTDVRGVPMPAQTVMFITDTFTPEKQKKKNVHYVLPDKVSEIPQGAFRVTIE